MVRSRWRQIEAASPGEGEGTVQHLGGRDADKQDSRRSLINTGQLPPNFRDQVPSGSATNGSLIAQTAPGTKDLLKRDRWARPPFRGSDRSAKSPSLPSVMLCPLVPVEQANGPQTSHH